jgi:hypothetical protein
MRQEPRQELRNEFRFEQRFETRTEANISPDNGPEPTEELFGFGGGGDRDEVFTDFVNPLTGDVLETDSGGGSSPPSPFGDWL